MRFNLKPIVLAYYLPQFHEIKENNLWWGKGFTEWTNVNSAKKYFKKHLIRKPVEPLGQYNILENNKIEHQFQIANEHGIDGFMIWNYWFGNNSKLLEKPIENILDKGLKVNYCLAWANHTWMNKSEGILLKEQKYLGKDDYLKYYDYLLPHFASRNYIKIANKPVFTIFAPHDVLDLDVFMDIFEKSAKESGFDGIFWLSENTNGNESYEKRFDYFYNSGKLLINRRFKSLNYYLEVVNRKIRHKTSLGPFKYNFEKLEVAYSKSKFFHRELPVIFTGWDSSIRHKRNGVILENFNELTFENHLIKINEIVKNNNCPIVIVKSWNEWAEGNLIEPDSIYGEKLLLLLKKYTQLLK